jgi:hypothetical protein
MDLLPFTNKMAADIHNATPGQSGLPPEEIFDLTGCLIFTLLVAQFVLDPKLQQGQKIPKCQPRTQQVVYLGNNLHHVQTVPIVLNITTCLCSPQYHVYIWILSMFKGHKNLSVCFLRRLI